MKRTSRDRMKMRLAKLIEDNCEVGVEFTVYDMQTWWNKTKKNTSPSTKQISKILPILNLTQYDHGPKVYGYTWDGVSAIWVVIDPYENAPSVEM